MFERRIDLLSAEGVGQLQHFLAETDMQEYAMDLAYGRGDPEHGLASFITDLAILMEPVGVSMQGLKERGLEDGTWGTEFLHVASVPFFVGECLAMRLITAQVPEIIPKMLQVPSSAISHHLGSKRPISERLPLIQEDVRNFGDVGFGGAGPFQDLVYEADRRLRTGTAMEPGYTQEGFGVIINLMNKAS